MRVGVDIGGTNIAAALVDDDCTISGKLVKQTMPRRDPKEIIDDIIGLCNELTIRYGAAGKCIEVVGIGIPGSIDRQNGQVIFTANVNLSGAYIGPAISDAFGCPVSLENDANAAAWGEVMAGAAKGRESCILVTVGTGIGGGIVIGGRIYTGVNGVAGEIGHMVVVKDGIECSCGRKGCWEVYASARGLTRMTIDSMDRHKDSLLWNLCPIKTNVDGKTAFEAMKAGDAAARAVIDEYISYLACGITNLINIFEPEVICIGGGVSAAGEALFTPLKALVSKEEYRHSFRHTELIPAILGNDAGLIGAAMLDKQIVR